MTDLAAADPARISAPGVAEHVHLGEQIRLDC